MGNKTFEKETSEPLGRFSPLIQVANLVKTGYKGEGEEYSNRGLATFLSL